MHTEEQAKTLWCPMVRAATVGTGACAVNTSADPNDTDCWNMCRGSYCAAWRWADPNSRYSSGERKGYCGLAGKGMA